MLILAFEFTGVACGFNSYSLLNYDREKDTAGTVTTGV